MRGLNEHFINLQEILDWAEHPRGPVRRDWTPDESDIEELKLVGFYYIRMKMPHLRIRELRDLFAVKQSWKEVKKALALETELTPEERKKLGIPSYHPKRDEDEEELDVVTEDERFPTTAEERDLREEAMWRDARKDQLKSFFQDAKEQVQIIKDSERPLTLARRALKNIEAIPNDPERLQEPQMDQVLSKIIARTNILRKRIQKRKKRKE